MKLLKLIIQNFGSIQDAQLELKDRGLVSIEGENLDGVGADSNGSGKSTVINAILWCLYGTFGKDAPADDVVNSEAGKNCMVQTSWTDGTRTYKIARYRKHSKYKNNITILQDRKDITKAGAANIQAQINEIMGADEMVFRAACFYQQENPLDIPAMSDKELKLLLEKVLPFEDLEEGHKAATEEVKSQKLHLQVLENKERTELAKVEHLMREAKHVLEDRNAHASRAREKNDEIDALIRGKNLARGVALLASSRLAEMDAEMFEIQQGFARLGNTDYETTLYRIGDKKKQIAKIEEELREPKTTCYACGQEVEDLTTVKEKLEKQLGGLQWEINDLEIELRTRQENWRERQGLKQRHDKLAIEIAEAKRNKDMVERLESEMKLLEGQRVDPLANPYTGSINRLKDALRASKKVLSAIQADVVAVKARLEILEAAQLTLSPKGLRYHMLESVAPVLTAATNKYLDILTDGQIKALWSTVQKVGKEYKEKFVIQAHFEGRDKFGLLSGGEKRKVRLACFFALQDVIASRATKNIEIWCGDEIDHALDGAGLERLMVLLNEITKKKSTILVISHHELREWIPNYAVVTRKDGVSSVSGYLNA